jgi:hypothetical protein
LGPDVSETARMGTCVVSPSAFAAAACDTIVSSSDVKQVELQPRSRRSGTI